MPHGLPLPPSMAVRTVPLKPTRSTGRLAFARVLAAFGAAVAAYEAVTWGRWLAAGPQQITQYRDTAATSWTVARGYEILIIAVSVWLLVRVVRQCRAQRRLTLDAQLLIGGVAALFWDPFGNFLQPAFFYSSNWLNLNTWTGFAPLVVNPDASRMPQPLFIMLVYPFGLLAFAMMSNAVMRAARRRFPRWSDAKVLAAGSVAAFLGGIALEAPMFLLHLWSLPGAPRQLSLFDNVHRYAAVEYLTTGMVFAGWAAVRYFKDDQGRAFTERGLGRTGSVLAMIGWCCSLLVNDMCDVGQTTGTRYGPCPGTPGFRMPVSLPGPAPFS